jgi:hypothetical protein
MARKKRSVKTKPKTSKTKHQTTQLGVFEFDTTKPTDDSQISGSDFASCLKDASDISKKPSFLCVRFLKNKFKRHQARTTISRASFAELLTEPSSVAPSNLAPELLRAYQQVSRYRSCNACSFMLL